MTARPNFAAVLADIDAMRDEREQDVQDAEVALRLADKRLHYAELDKDRRLWSPDESSEYYAALDQYTDAQRDLRAAQEAL